MSDFDYDRYTSGNYVKFEEPGDKIVGTIKEIREGSDFNGNPCPVLVLEVSDDGDEMTLTAGQALLKVALAEKRPKVGDRVRITYTGSSVSRSGRTAKNFEVEVKEGPHPLVQATVADSEAPF